MQLWEYCQLGTKPLGPVVIKLRFTGETRRPVSKKYGPNIAIASCACPSNVSAYFNSTLVHWYYDLKPALDIFFPIMHKTASCPQECKHLSVSVQGQCRPRKPHTSVTVKIKAPRDDIPWLLQATLLVMVAQRAHPQR